MSKRLFDASDDSDAELQLNTNKDYAKSYNNFRKKELLKKYKDRGIDVSESESSSEDDSSEDDEVVDPKFDGEFFKTLASLKSKDPSIYDRNTRFFHDSNSEEDSNEREDKLSNKKTKKSKPVTLKDYERKIILERGGKFEDDSDGVDEEEAQRSASPTLVEEERRLKASLKKVVAQDSGDEEFGGLFKKREKNTEEKAKEEVDYAQWLSGKKEDIEEKVKEKLDPLKTYWNSSKLTQSERFLRDYILNKGYANTESSKIPTYEEIVNDDSDLSDDEQELEKQAEFEQKYNFRFEEPDAEFIKRYPRTIENSVRRTNDKRKQKRQETKDRKQHEKEQLLKEYEMVKEMKRKEIEEKISKLKMVMGCDELNFKEEELEEEFDPEAHDKRMQEIFNDDYYQVDEGEDKPECPSDIDDLQVEDWDNYDPEKGVPGLDGHEPHCEDDDFNMDCEYDASTAKEKIQRELIENTKSRRGRRRRNRFMEMIQAEKPAFNPDDEKTYADYIDEYYKMDCEDIIGDTTCRFKYIETTPNDFGLSIEEILFAKNKELNQWASLKKAVQIRPENTEKRDQRMYRLKSKNMDLKRKIFKSLYGDGSDDDNDNDESVEKSDVDEVNNKKAKNFFNNSNSQGEDDTELSSAKKIEPIDEENLDVPIKNPTLDETATNSCIDQSGNDAKTSTSPVKSKKKKKPKKKSNGNAFEMNPQGKLEQPGSCSTANSTNKEQKVKLPSKKPKSDNNPFRSTNKKGNEKNSGNDRSRPKTHRNLVGRFKSKATPKRKKSNPSSNANNTGISDDRLKAYGINPRKFFKKKKFSNQKV